MTAAPLVILFVLASAPAEPSAVAPPAPPGAGAQPASSTLQHLLSQARQALDVCDARRALPLIEKAAAVSPQHPAPWIYRASAFQMLASREGGKADWKEKAHRALEEAVRRADAVDERAAPAETLFWVGEAYGLMAVQLAENDEWFRSARLGKKMRSCGLEAIHTDPDLSDAYVLTGTYDYFAAELPAVVKFLRFFLLLPGGNRERGIDALERALDGGGTAARQAGYLLQRILLYERRYERAVRVGREMLRQNPRDGQAWMLLAKALVRDGRPEEAAELLGETVEPETSCLLPRDRWEARLLRVAALVRASRFEVADRVLAQLVAEGQPPSGVTERLSEVLALLKAAVRDHEGHREEAAALCRSVAARSSTETVRLSASACVAAPLEAEEVPLWF